MPLRAVVDGQDLFAFKMNDEEWDLLKTSYRDHLLVTHCCSRPAIPCTRNGETHYFRHKAKLDCAYASESKEHLFLKDLIARSAQAAGWDVYTEWSGQTPSGERWEADVYCQSEGRRVAFEIQVSSQTTEEVRRRTNKYRESGVSVYWIAKESRFKKQFVVQEQEVPLFCYWLTSESESPFVRAFGVSVQEFVAGVLSSRLQLTNHEYTETQNIRYCENKCFFCHKSIKYAYGIYLGGTLVTIENEEKALAMLLNRVPNRVLESLGVTKIVSQASKVYLECPECHRVIPIEKVLSRQLTGYVGERGAYGVETYSVVRRPERLRPQWIFSARVAP